MSKVQKIGIIEEEANYDIGMMYLNAEKWKDAFRFLVKSADCDFKLAVKEIIRHFNPDDGRPSEEVREFIEENTEFCKRLDAGKVSWYCIGMMHLAAENPKDAFPFLVKSADCDFELAVKEIIQRFNVYELPSEFNEFIIEQTEFFKRLDAGKVSWYYLGIYSLKGDYDYRSTNTIRKEYLLNSARAGFILGVYRLGLWYYREKLYNTAQHYYQKVVEHQLRNEWIPKAVLGSIHNDLSLCGWFQNEKDVFLKSNETARNYGSPIAFSNLANGYFTKSLVCDKPDYETALKLYEKSREAYLNKNEDTKYVDQQIKLCKENIEKLREEKIKNNEMSHGWFCSEHGPCSERGPCYSLK